jgi:L-serine/L-threonine ammonia-lyase
VFPVVVSDEQALQACDQFLHDHRVWVEPACGAALAALDLLPRLLPALFTSPLGHPPRVLVVVCGGVNVVAAGR